jgi:hypothetical protein
MKIKGNFMHAEMKKAFWAVSDMNLESFWGDFVVGN